jgi:N-acetylglucosamine kinase-like BadF-type ATPase
MIIVADSGSTKTDWLIGTSLKTVQRIRTQGLNPYFVNDDEVIEVLKELLHQIQDPLAITGVYFYGSGLSSDLGVRRFEHLFRQCFPAIEIQVHHDLIGACLAASGEESSMVGILGTGANSCVFEHGKITHNVPSLGYVLGDEGSGADIGKRLLRLCMLEEGNTELSADLFQDLGMSHDEIIARVYQGGLANRWMAKLTTFAMKHRTNPKVQAVLNDAFSSFLDDYVCRYPQHKTYRLNMVGSIGIIFKEELEAACAARGVKLGNMVKRPIEPLFEHHL